jgi:hypothetical protein
MTGDELMRAAQLTPEYRPLVDFKSDYGSRQGARGWRYGFTDAARRPDNGTLFQEFIWVGHPNGQIPDGAWRPSAVRPAAFLGFRGFVGRKKRSLFDGSCWDWTVQALKGAWRPTALQPAASLGFSLEGVCLDSEAGVRGDGDPTASSPMAHATQVCISRFPGFDVA